MPQGQQNAHVACGSTSSLGTSAEPLIFTAVWHRIASSPASHVTPLGFPAGICFSLTSGMTEFGLAFMGFSLLWFCFSLLKNTTDGFTQKVKTRSRSRDSSLRTFCQGLQLQIPSLEPQPLSFCCISPKVSIKVYTRNNPSSNLSIF